MTYKTILVALTELDRMTELIGAARALGARYQAHVTGLFVVPAVQIYPSAGMGALPDVYDGNRKIYMDQLEAVRARFEDGMSDDGLSYAFHKVDAPTALLSSTVVEQGRDADLIVVSATDVGETLGVEPDFVQRVVLSAGRPVLVLPHAGPINLAPDVVLVGWDNGREAARAVFDSMPLLRKAGKVLVARVDETPRGSLSGAGIAESLSRHGVKAEVVNVPSDGLGAGAALLRAAHDHGAGLVVMGAYGHSRFTEFVFGGATRHAIRNIDRPLLMSH
jgi:nucleotide-binding universal stress UspA family protein